MQKKTANRNSAAGFQRIFADQVEKQFQQTIFGTAATLINGTILVYILRNHITASYLATWFAIAVFISGVRLSLNHFYHRSERKPSFLSRWNKWFNISLLLAGCLWGSTTFFLLSLESIGRQAFIAFIVGGMVAGAVASFTAILSAFFLFSIPALVPVGLSFFYLGDEIHMAMGVMVFLYLIIVSLTALKMHRDVVDLLAMKYENIDLIRELQDEVDMRKQAQNDLRKQNEHIEEIVQQRTMELENVNQRLQAILTSAPLVIWALDSEGEIIFAEGTGLQRFGLAKGEVVGKTVPELFPKIRSLHDATMRALAGKPVAEMINLRGIYFEVRYQPIEQGGAISGAIGVGIDVSAQQKAKKELRKAQETYQEIIESLNDVLYYTDDAGIIKFISPAVTRVLGHHSDELIDSSFYDLVFPDDKDQLQLDIDNVSQENRSYGEYRFFDKNGDIRWCRVSTSRTINAREEEEIQGVLVDITQFKKLEDQLQRSQKMEALGTLAGGVAHDLNNILSGIVSYPELLLLDVAEDSPLYAPLITIKKSGEQAAAIVQDLLTLARRGVSTHDLLDINIIIRECLAAPEFKKNLEDAANVALSLNLREDVLGMYGSSIHIYKAIANLLINGLEAMPDGGMLQIITDHFYVDEPITGYETIAEGEYVVCTIKDSGVGIPEENKAQIFEPFYTKKVMGKSGSGLGMAVVWGTVKDHKGYIDVQSEEGRGATFHLYFPATRDVLATRPKLADIDEYFGNGERILVVDDLQTQLDIAKSILTRLGYNVDTVTSGEEALAFLADNTIDLIILDMIMNPGIDGLDTYRQISKIRPQQKVVIATGYSETSRVAEAQQMGASRLIKKPYSMHTIGQVIQEELQRT
ncbi:MAG: PAS domain S-box protein [Desulfocapsaceae bacterium]|nr:PAS domain S-box protein [Desulfocapsaceae bacterium]